MRGRGAEQLYAAYTSCRADARGVRGAALPAHQPYPHADWRRDSRARDLRLSRDRRGPAPAGSRWRAEAASSTVRSAREPQAAARREHRRGATAGAEIYRAGRASSSRSAAASPATASAQTLDVLARQHSSSSARRCRPGTRVLRLDDPAGMERSATPTSGTRHGERVVDFADHNLHVLNYSVPVRGTMPLRRAEEPYLHAAGSAGPHSLPHLLLCRELGLLHGARPAAGRLPDGLYEVVIDSTLEDGISPTANICTAGRPRREFLLSAHICHPSLANDNCSGLALLAMLANAAQSATDPLQLPLPVRARHDRRARLACRQSRHRLDRIDHGLVVSCVGDGGGPTYKRSRRGNAVIDRAMAQVLRDGAGGGQRVDFSPYGYDERQYCSPGFNLPVGLFQRSAVRDLSGVPYVGRQSGLHQPGASGRLLSHDHGCHRASSRATGRRSTCFRRASRSSAGAASIPRSAATSRPESKTMALLWVLNLADGGAFAAVMAERSGMQLRAHRSRRRPGCCAGHGLLA